MINNIKAGVTFFFVFAFCSNIYIALEFISPVGEFYWFLLLFAVSAVLFLLTPFESLANMPKSAFIWLIFAILSITVSYIYSSQSPVVTEVLISLAKSISVFVCMFILMTHPKAIKAALYALALVVVVAASNNIIEFFTDFMTWSTIPGRAAGWQINANRSGKFMAMSLLFASIIIPKKFIWPMIGLTIVGVLITFSRATWVELFIIIVGISLIRGTPLGQKINLLDIKPSSFIAIAIGGIIASILLLSLFTGAAYDFVKDTSFEEYLSADTVGRMSGDFDDSSANERVVILIDALKMGMEHPFLGSGLASTYEWKHDVGPHNDYATLFAERGVTGVFVYLVLLGMLWFTSSKYGKLYVLVLAFSSIATHNTFEQPATFIFLALAFLHRDGFGEKTVLSQPDPYQNPINGIPQSMQQQRYYR